MKYSRKSRSERGYTYAWQKARKRFLAEHPMCVMCEEQGVLRGATIVDHITPHRGDMELFWEPSNWQALCKPHHDGAKQSMEHTGILRGASVDGLPTCPNHPWNKPTKGSPPRDDRMIQGGNAGSGPSWVKAAFLTNH